MSPETENDREFYELRPLTEEEIGLIRAYIMLDGLIPMLDDQEAEGTQIAHLENKQNKIRTDYDLNVRGMLIQTRRTIADIAFQQGFAIHIVVAMNESGEG